MVTGAWGWPSEISVITLHSAVAAEEAARVRTRAMMVARILGRIFGRVIKLAAGDIKAGLFCFGMSPAMMSC